MRRKVISVGVVLAIFAAGGVLGTVIQAVAQTGHSVSVGDATAGEDAGTIRFPLTLSPAPGPGETISVKVVTADVSAAGGESCSVPTNPDYVTIAPAGTGIPVTTDPAAPAVGATIITWSDGDTTKTQDVTVCQDGTIEEDETFTLTASPYGFTCIDPCEASSAATMGDPQGVGTIVDDETKPALSVGDLSEDEGDAAQTAFAFPVRLSAPSDRTITVKYATVDVTADSPEDYVAKSGELTFAARDVEETIAINVAGDVIAEPDETFFVNLSDASNASIVDPQGVGMIQNDDGTPAADPTFEISDVSVDEGNAGSSPSTPFTFVVTLSQPPAAGNTNTVSYHTSDDSAVRGSDYAVTTGQLVFNAGETAKTVTVPVFGDSEFEPNEEFRVFLTSPDCTLVGCVKPVIVGGSGTGTIGNDDAAPPTPTPSDEPTATPSDEPTATPSDEPTATPSDEPTATPSNEPTASPSSSPTASPTPALSPISSVLKIGGYFQMRVTSSAPCQANRAMKIKQSVPGTDRVILTGVTDGDGLYKVARRPIKSGRFYGQVYDNTKTSSDDRPVLCLGAKSPIRSLGF